MKILFIHQNFPGQFKHLAPALSACGHTIVAMTMRNTSMKEWRGVKLVRYAAGRGSSSEIHPWVADFETKVIRGEACFRSALQMKAEGFSPDLIIAHPAWGESMFIKEVWPKAKLGIYCEFFYRSHGADMGFDPEFSVPDPDATCRLQLKNLNNMLHFEAADAGISPTQWQADTFPEPFRSRITVIHDGIDTSVLIPNPSIHLTLNDNLKLTRADEVITFVSRNLEPYRGFHIFMRALPEILMRCPNAKVLIVGGDGVSYGKRPENGQTWKEIFLSEVRSDIPESEWERVHFLGTIPYQRFLSVLQLSRVHIYLTYPFVLSWSLLEAMSVGCAIVASGTKPLHESIKHGEHGRLVNFFDVKGLAEEVCSLLGAPEERERLGRNARQYAQKRYDLSVCLPRQLAWIEGLMGDEAQTARSAVCPPSSQAKCATTRISVQP